MKRVFGFIAVTVAMTICYEAPALADSGGVEKLSYSETVDFTKALHVLSPESKVLDGIRIRSAVGSSGTGIFDIDDLLIVCRNDVTGKWANAAFKTEKSLDEQIAELINSECLGK